MKTIGLTGIMGAGKSSVIRLLKEAEVPVLDCDAINAQLLEPGNAGWQALCQRYGDALLHPDGTIDKVKMSNVIFRNEMEKQAVEAILHPLIKAEIAARLSQLDVEQAVVEVPLLFEVKWEDSFDEIWVVSCQEEILLERLQKFRGVSYEEAKRRLAHQIPQKEKCERAHVVLYNDKDLDSLRTQVLQALGRDEDAGENRMSAGQSRIAA